jgi:hypothetical protein
MEQTVLATMKPLTDTILNTLPTTLTEEQKKAFRQAYDEQSVIMVNDLVRQMKPIIADVYTEQELTDIVAFMQTSSAQAMLAKGPVLSQRMVPLLPQLQREFVAGILGRVCKQVDCGAERELSKPKAS